MLSLKAGNACEETNSVNIWRKIQKNVYKIDDKFRKKGKEVEIMLVFFSCTFALIN